MVTSQQVKNGGDKGGSSFKMNFQIVTKPCCQHLHPRISSPRHYTITNLHVALKRYKQQLKDLEGCQWRYLCRRLKLEHLDITTQISRDKQIRVFLTGDYDFCADCTESQEPLVYPREPLQNSELYILSFSHRSPLLPLVSHHISAAKTGSIIS